jgi:hypothetical protein
VAFLGISLVFVALISFAVYADWAARQEQVRQLRALARSLEGGRAIVPGGVGSTLADGRVDGRLLGHQVQVTFARDGGRKKGHVARLDVVVAHSAASFEVEEAGVLDRLGRWLGLSEDALGADDLALRHGAAGARRLIQASEVKRAIRRVLHLPGVSKVTLRGSMLRIERRLHGSRVDAAELERALDALVALAHRCDRVPVKIAVRPVEERFAWTDGGADARCPYCHDGLDPAADDVESCGKCRTVHHRECLAEAGGCTVFGCGERSPPRERAS